MSLVYRTHSKSLVHVCNVDFKGSKYPDIGFYTSAKYNVPPYGTDHWWAVAPYSGRHRGKIIFNTSARMIGRWYELWPDPARRLVVLDGLVGHESSHLMLATMTQSYGFPPDDTYIYWLQRYYGVPITTTVSPLEDAAMDRTMELDAKLTLWQRFLKRLRPDKIHVVSDRDDMMVTEFENLIGMRR